MKNYKIALYYGKYVDEICEEEVSEELVWEQMLRLAQYHFNKDQSEFDKDNLIIKNKKYATQYLKAVSHDETGDYAIAQLKSNKIFTMDEIEGFRNLLRTDKTYEWRASTC